MQSQKKKRITLICVAIIVILIGQFAEVRGSNVLLLSAIVIATIYGMFCDISQLAGLVLLLVAPNRLLTYGPISAPAIIMLLGVIRLSLHGKLRLRTSTTLWSALLILLSVITILNGNSQIISTIKVFVVLYFIKLYFYSDCIEDKYVDLVENCSIGCIITSLLTFVINPRALSESVRFSLTGSGGENVLGILCAIMFLNLLNIMLFREDHHKSFHILTAVGLVFICLLTGSRTAALCLVVGMAGIFVVSCLRLNFKQAAIMLLSVGTVVLLSYYLTQGNNLIANYVQRFVYRAQKLAGTDISNGRFEIWRMYTETFKIHPAILWFGGMNYASYGINIVAHNMILEQIAEYGIIGSFVIFLLYCHTYRDIAFESGSKAHWLSAGIIPIVALLVVSMFSHTLLGIPQTMMLFISAYGILEANQ